MHLGRIAGNVVCTRKVPELEGFKLLLVEQETVDGKPKGTYVVAVDVVGAGDGERVLLVQGSSARQTRKTDRKPVDAAVVGIVDSVHLDL